MQEFLRKNKQILQYIFWGFFAAILNIEVFYICANIIWLSGSLSNIIAWAAAVIFAFFTNKHCVFKDAPKNKSVWKEFTEFTAGRVFSGSLETVLIFLLLDVLDMPSMPVKVALSVLVAVLNYILSKQIVFKK